MGQENEIKDSQTFLNDLASHEEKLKKENISSDDSFEKAKKIALSYLSYEQVINNNAEEEKEEKEKKPANKNLKIIEDNKENKLGEINKEFEILKEWIKLVITPYKSDQKVGNNKESINFDNYTDKALEPVDGSVTLASPKTTISFSNGDVGGKRVFIHSLTIVY